jgi:hypothetical protein
MTSQRAKKLNEKKVSADISCDMYSNEHLCPTLTTKEACFRVQRYKDGKLEEVFHEHVPSHRLSLDTTIEVLRALVGHYAVWPATFLLQSRLNNRRGGPSRYPVFIGHFNRPEKGVIRRYLSANRVTAWSDSVVMPGTFRRHVGGQGRRNSSSRFAK